MAEPIETAAAIKLPAIDRKKRWTVAVLGYVIFSLLYTLTGNLHWRPPTTLSPSRLDEGVPFLSWTVWIYHSQFFFLALCIAALKETRNISRTLYAMALASMISFLLFAIYPTTIPRAVQPAAGWTGRAFELLYAIDSAANCLPSLHVSLAWIAAAGVLRESRGTGVFACLWALLITLSTMTTKQHYLVDVVAGLALTVLCRPLVRQK